MKRLKLDVELSNFIMYENIYLSKAYGRTRIFWQKLMASSFNISFCSIFACIFLGQFWTTLREESNAEKSPAEQKNAELKNANLVQNSHSFIPHFSGILDHSQSFIPHFLNSILHFLQCIFLPFKEICHSLCS